jgi:hypothetical protein
VLTEIILGELNKLSQFVRDNEDEFVRRAMENSAATQDSEMQTAKKALRIAEKRINELDDLFERLYEDNVSGKISDERFATMSARYEAEQSKLKADAAKLSETISRKEQKKNDVMNFVGIVKKYEEFTELTSEIMHELIDRIVVHAPEGGRANRTQQVDIHFREQVLYSISTLFYFAAPYDLSVLQIPCYHIGIRFGQQFCFKASSLAVGYLSNTVCIGLFRI